MDSMRDGESFGHKETLRISELVAGSSLRADIGLKTAGYAIDDANVKVGV
jgi:hypothetical protein